ncbi:MAG: T9SS type A sorting domain-containing protein [Candidatus Cloacimonetes bacterium]|nr:T9SS type A sorting domain-containing protein [Candidatus Cloacimonadota bacterium]
MYKKLIIAAIFILFSNALLSEIRVVSSTPAHLSLEFKLGDYALRDINVDDQNFRKIFADGSGSLEAGAPDLPTQAVWIAIPRGTKADISFKTEDVAMIRENNLAPVPQPAPEMKDAPAPAYICNKKIYGSNQIYPQSPAALEKDSDYRSQSCAVVRFYPFQYNPQSGELQINNYIRADITFQGAAQPLKENLNYPGLQEYISSFTINGEEIVSYENSLAGARENWRDTGCDLLIFCPDIFVGPANDLADWKERKGIITQVVPTSISGATSFSISNYIADYCENNDPAPQYIMLFGDAEFIPPWYVHQDPYDGMMLGTDIYYADLEMEFDYLLDFAFGRLPLDTLEDAQRMVDNIISYELDPPTDPLFYQKAVIAGAFQDGSSGSPPDTYADRRFAKTSEDIRNFLSQAGYAPERIYAEYNGYNNSTIYPTYWNQNTYIFENDIPGGELPLEIQKPQFPWNATGFDVNSAMNAGSFLLSHRDHGGRSGWGEPDYGSSEVDQLVNGNLLPVVWSVNCLTGYFDNETDEPGAGTGDNSECFVEHWFRNPNGGAIGIVGSTRVSYSGNNDRFVWGLMDAIWPDFLEWCGADYPNHNAIYRMGDVVNYGKIYLSLNSHFEDYLWITYEEFEWFGDPTMEIWATQPVELNVTHNNLLEYGSAELTVNAGLTGAICTLWNGEEVIAQGISGFDNTAHITPGAFSYVDELVLTVSYSQKLPYTAVITVIPPQAGFLELETLLLDDAAGNSNGLADFSETINLGMQLHNIGLETVTGFDLTLASASPYVTIINDYYNFTGSIASLATVNLTDMFQFAIADNCPDGAGALLQISSAQFNFEQEILLHAPQLNTGYFSISDEDGNNNGAADPGETVIINLPVINSGSSSIEDVMVLLLSYDPYISVTPAQIVLDSLGTQPVILQFTGTISPSAPLGLDYQLQAFVSSGAYNFDRLMSGNYGYAVEDFEAGDFSLFDWQMNGTCGWMIDTDAASGSFSARSELMGVNSWAELAVSGFLAEDAVIGFYRKLYADTSLPDNNGGILYFLIDEQEIASWGGNRPWQFLQYEVPSGPHTFRWIFEKDMDPTLGYDGAWIDRIEFPNMSPPPPPLLVIDTDMINMTLGQGNEADVSLYLTNAGAGSVEYYLYFQDNTRDLADSRLTINTYQYYPGQTTGWLLRLENNGTGSEAITDLDVTFPAEVNVNVATPLTGGSGGVLMPDGSTGSGITVNWHGATEEGTGYLLPGETAQCAVNVTIAGEAPLSVILEAQITGDQGSLIQQQIRLGNLTNGWLTLSSNNGALVYGQNDEIILSFSAADLETGIYQQNIIVFDNFGNETIIPVYLEVVASEATATDIPQVTELTGIYPNPFNPRTTVSFRLAQQENVSLTVYNVKGQKIAEILNKQLPAGKHNLIWDAADLSSGIYFLKFKTDSSQDIKRTLLLK